MLTSLRIKNYALIEDVEVNFGEGLNIITGETGAGKSILIGAMGMILGDRATAEVIRRGTNKSILEAVFDVSGNEKIRRLLEENDYDYSDELILRREISLKGTNRNFVNDTPATLNFIKEVGNLLVDIHGQHEHQSVLRTQTHIEMLDEFGDYGDLLLEYEENYKLLNSLNKELKDLTEKEALLKEKKELYEFQLKEIEEVSPEPDEDETIESELKILENAEQILNLSEEVYLELYESENSLTERLGSVIGKLETLAEFDKEFSDKISEAEGALSVLDDIARTLASYKSKIEVDPERLEEMRERLGSLNLLKKKYGGTISAVLNYKEKISKEYETAVNFSDKKEKLSGEIEKLKNKLLAIGTKLSEERKKTAEKLKQNIESSLQDLGISHAVFETKVEQVESAGIEDLSVKTGSRAIRLFKNGIDKVEFFISTNQGEDPKPLVKVASGGEISRIMLAMKSSLAKNDKLPLLIFDEIDTGVSGRIARKVGAELKNLSRFHQIIAITHLPQIAALADRHFKVEKYSFEGRAVSGIRELSEQEKLEEIASLLSGETVTDSALSSAKELLRSN